ncbi:gamma-glutamyltransferase [Lutispora sp.]|uniref:gamma-glutamyltransferase n=1 Tax=Lutispora sp. TaxID=2828727 RepID=UPI002B21F6C0|nr:gamma-glutamyltransferase [Lutispora sp.]MEA4962970.1 gamma-glutamyltransferase [Lutispora sp.]
MDVMRKSCGKHAVVSTARIEASKIGIEIFKNGGNAIDAAVAVGFALGVCEPSTSGLGGGGFMMIKDKTLSEPIVIDFRENAPRNANEDMWKFSEDGKVQNKENQIGGKSVAVPGEVAGLLYALEKYGTMSAEEVIGPAAELAEKGFVVTEMMQKHFTDYEDYLRMCPGSADLYFKKNKIKVGKICRNKDLANTLKNIAKYGAYWFYKGELAKKIIDCVKQRGGVMTAQDLEEYKITVRKPVVGSYRGYKIYSNSLPSSGGAHIIQTLNILENFDIGSMEVNSAEYLHIFSEAFKKVYTDRAKNMADGDFYEVPIKGITSKEYAKRIAGGVMPHRCIKISIEDPWKYEHADTTHYSIGDSEGNMVSVTKTINHFCGSCMVPEGTGFILNDTMSDFSVVKGDINAVEPFKKPLSTMSPTIIMKDNKPFAILGSPGGERIICNVVQVISKLIDHKMSIDAAIDSARITENVKCKIFYEGRIDRKVIKQLQALGHETEKVLDYDIRMGGVQGVVYMDDGAIEGAADPRRDGEAIGY